MGMDLNSLIDWGQFVWNWLHDDENNRATLAGFHKSLIANDAIHTSDYPKRLTLGKFVWQVLDEEVFP
jgi:hypothetical protein